MRQVSAAPAVEEPAAEPAGEWRGVPARASLAETFRSLPIPPRSAGVFKRLLAFAGPGYLVAVGYMDPGNWATDLAGGSAYGYLLLSVVLLSSLSAMVLQALAARLGIGAGRDLAQACRDAFPAWVNIPLWLLCELAIVACDLAEVIGAAVALQLLFGLPLLLGVLLTGADVLLLLLLARAGVRWLEALVIALLAVIAGAFAVELALSHPDWGAAAAGLIPSARVFADPAALYLAVGIVGATVMPHNLYLHSALVQSRRFDLTEPGRRDALRFAVTDSTVALSLAFFINAAILVLAASAFHARGLHEVAELQDAHRLLSPLLGAPAAAMLFAVALLAAGQNSTVTGTLAGQVVMEGFIGLRLKPWLRRVITRGLALVPAVAVAALYGQSGVGRLLILSQVVLSLQLPFAMVPLLLFTADRRKMGALASPVWLTATGVVIAAVILAADAVLLVNTIKG